MQSNTPEIIEGNKLIAEFMQEQDIPALFPTEPFVTEVRISYKQFEDLENQGAMTPEQKPTMEDVLKGNIESDDNTTAEERNPYYVRKDVVYAAMKEWEQITNKERDDEIKRLRAIIFKAHNLAVCDLPKEEQEKYWDEFVTENNL